MSTLTRIIFLLFFLTCLIVPSSAWLAGYTYRQGHYINGSDSGAQSNYQVMLNVSNTVGASSGNLMYLNAHSVVFPDDIRFTDTSDTQWDHWVESNNTTYATIWVEVPSIPSGSTNQVELYCYYGKAGDTSASNGTLTFPSLFDHFDGTSLNTSKWTSSGSSVAVESSAVLLNRSGSDVEVKSISGFGPNNSIRKYIKNAHYDTSYRELGIYYVSGSKYDLEMYDWDGISNSHKFQTTFTTATKVDFVAGAWSADTWGISDLILNGTYSQDLVLNGYHHVSTTTLPIGSGTFGFRAQSVDNSKIYCDWILVRKYVYPEPLHSTWDAEEGLTPVADFTSNVTGGYPPFTVLFYDTSTNTPTAWDWYFPNGGDAHASPATWTFDYNIENSATSYNIELNVSNACGSDWENKTAYITAYPLEAHFSANTTSGTSPLCVQFTDATTNGTPINWSWDFGDGNTSFDHNPTHCYSGVGLYTVRLNASNLYSWDWLNETNYINVTAVPTPTPTPTPTVGNGTIYPSTYLSEETAVPFELFILLIILGVVFLGLGIALASPMHIVVVSLMGMMFLAAAAFVAPVVGFFNYEAFQITNATTGNVSMTFIPSVSLVAQPWVSWLLWGMFLVGLINLGVRGVGGWWMETGQKRDEWER